MDNLLTCPFCGGEAAMQHVSQLWEPKDNYWAACKCCYMSGKTYRTESEAIAAWNTRYHSEFEKTVIKAWKEIQDYTERTCKEYGSVRVWQSCNVWSHELSCGHEVDTLDNEPPNYCPSCGAKVIGGNE